MHKAIIQLQAERRWVRAPSFAGRTQLNTTLQVVTGTPIVRSKFHCDPCKLIANFASAEFSQGSWSHPSVS